MDRHTNPIADRVAATIARLDHSKKSVAESAGIPLTTFNRKLSGRGDFTIPELDQVARAIGVTVSDLIPSEVLTGKAVA